jgi:hypothetical protein
MKQPVLFKEQKADRPRRGGGSPTGVACAKVIRGESAARHIAAPGSNIRGASPPLTLPRQSAGATPTGFGLGEPFVKRHILLNHLHIYIISGLLAEFFQKIFNSGERHSV